MMNDKEIQSFRHDLLDWYDANRRELPWRTHPTLYKTVISEFMLQQTQVATVLPYFDRWLKSFPDFDSLAKAPQEKVLKHWEGLGYYNRARNLHRLAQEISQLEKPPQDYHAWLVLPGIGPYTAAAITSIAQNLTHPVIDGNVVRVLTRLTADGTHFKSLAEAQKHLNELAHQLVYSKRPGDYNQALMEIGATICRPKSPACLICPVQNHCKANREKTADQFPNIIKKKIEKLSIDRSWIFEDQKILLSQIPTTSKRLAGIYELPEKNEFANLAHEKKALFKKKRGISNQSFTEIIYRAKKTPTSLQKKHRWVQIDELDSIQISGPHKKWIQENS